MAKALGPAFQMAFAAATAAAAVTVGAVVGVTAAIIKLGERGADVADISDQFEILNNEIGNTSGDVLGKLRTAFAGTVSDFEIMKATNVALSQGLQLNADEFELTAQAARVLADRTGGDAVEAYKTLTTAMATGNDRMLKGVALNYDAATAVEAHAKAIGIEKAELRESEVIAAKKTATLAELARTVKVSGLAQYDFADAVKASGAMVDNFKDSLGKAIAQSPVVQAMLKSFQSGIEAGFGVDQQAMVKKLIGFVNDFAIMMVDVALTVVTSVDNMRWVWAKYFKEFAQDMAIYTKGLEIITGALAGFFVLQAKLPGQTQAFKDAAEAALALANRVTANRVGWEEQVKIAGQLEKGTDGFSRALKTAKEGLTDARAAMIKARDSHVEFVGPIQKVTGATSNFTGELGREAEAASETSAQIERLTASYRKQIAAHEARQQAVSGPLPTPADFRLPRVQLLGEGPLTSQALAEIAALQKAADDWAASMGATLAPAMRGYAGNLEEVTDKTKTLGETIRGNLTQALNGIPDTLARAFEGGGGLAGAFKSIGIQLAQAIAAPIKKELTNLQQGAINVGSGIAAAIGGKLGGGTIGTIAGVTSSLAGAALAASTTMGTVALGAATMGIGAAAVGVALLVRRWMNVGKEVRKANAEIEKSRQALLEHYGSLERIDQLGKAVGIDLAAAWQHQGKAGKAAFEAMAKQFEAAVAAMEAELGSLQGELESTFNEARSLGYNFDKDGKLVSVSFDKLTEKAKEFGVSVDGLGPAFRQQGIDAEAKRIIDAFTLMDKAGGDVGGILVGMKDEIGKLVGKSIELGTTVPENMKPWVQRLIDTHQLLDENGREITDIGKIKFGAPIETQFEQISKKILDLIAKIDELVNVLLRELTPALDTATRDRTVRVGVKYDLGDPPDYAARGGLVTAQGVRYLAAGGPLFQPRGTDTIPAMLTPGERVLSVDQNRSFEAVLERLAMMQRSVAPPSRSPFLLAPSIGTSASREATDSMLLARAAAASSAPAQTIVNESNITFEIHSFDADGVQTAVEKKIYPALRDLWIRGHGVSDTQKALGIRR